MEQKPGNQDQVFDLASLLNILWRRRLLVLGLPALGLLVGLAYGIFGTRRWDAIATIRPGITAYDPAGGPVRQWQLKDVTRWYDQGLYRQELLKKLDMNPDSRPVIRTEFIAQGLTNLQGGEVITLWTTGTSPDLAAALIDTSLTVFNDYAESDTVSSQLKLTRDGLELQILELKNRRLAVDQQEAVLDLRIAAARAESLVVANRLEEMALDLKMLDFKFEYCTGRVADLRAEEPILLNDLESLAAALGRGEGLEDLAQARLDVRRALARNRALTDSLAYEGELVLLERVRWEFKRAAQIKAELGEVERKLGELHLESDIDITSRRNDLALQIDARQRKLGLLAPLQRVGQTLVSNKPVRPRTLRATSILVFLGIMGGLVLAFGWDFVSANRRKIFRS